MTANDTTEPTGEPDTDEDEVNLIQQDAGPGIVARVLWFVFIGWWASGIWLTIAWLFNLTIIGIPVGIKMVNRVPKVLTLKPRPLESVTTEGDAGVTITQSNREQYNLVIRGLWFVLIGWWASGVVTFLAWVASVTIIGLPIAIWLYHKLPFVVSLYRY